MRDLMIGERLALLRGEQTQKTCAEQLGIALGTYSRYERNKQLPESKVLFYYYNQGISVDWILGGTGTMRREDAPKTMEDTLFDGVDYVAIARSVPAPRTSPNPLQTHAQLDLQELQEALEAVKEGLESMGRKVPAAQEAALTSHVFGLLRKKAGFSEVLRYLRTATEP